MEDTQAGPLRAEEIAGLRELEAAASPAPWRFAGLSTGGGTSRFDIITSWGIPTDFYNRRDGSTTTVQPEEMRRFGSREYQEYDEENADERRSWHWGSDAETRDVADRKLIAAMRNALTRLLSTVEETQERVRFLEKVAASATFFASIVQGSDCGDGAGHDILIAPGHACYECEHQELARYLRERTQEEGR
jgi:hypothetical protein